MDEIELAGGWKGIGYSPIQVMILSNNIHIHIFIERSMYHFT
ncbi:hypothetical protein NNU90_002298 [Citrobacter farmeri]